MIVFCGRGENLNASCEEDEFVMSADEGASTAGGIKESLLPVPGNVAGCLSEVGGAGVGLSSLLLFSRFHVCDKFGAREKNSVMDLLFVRELRDAPALGAIVA